MHLNKIYQIHHNRCFNIRVLLLQVCFFGNFLQTFKKTVFGNFLAFNRQVYIGKYIYIYIILVVFFPTLTVQKIGGDILKTTKRRGEGGKKSCEMLAFIWTFFAGLEPWDPSQISGREKLCRSHRSECNLADFLSRSSKIGDISWSWPSFFVASAWPGYLRCG